MELGRKKVKAPPTSSKGESSLLDQKTTTKRKAGPWRFIELFTWSCMMTIVAGVVGGWDAFQPVTLPEFDLLTLNGREDARKYLAEVDPDFIMLAWPCSPWSP